MFTPSKLECSSSSTAIKRIKGDENVELMIQPSYQCKLCSRVFNKKQAFKNHKFMHLKKNMKKLKQSSKSEFVQNSSCLTDTKLPETVQSELKSYENIDLEESFTSLNKVNQKAEEIIKLSSKIHSHTFQQNTDVGDKLKNETINLINSSTNSTPGVSELSLNIDMNQSYICPFCDKVFTNKKTYLNHKKNHRKKRNSALKITLTKSNFEQVIINFIRSIRQETESSKPDCIKCDSHFDLKTLTSNVPSNNSEFSNKEKSGVSSSSPIISENRTPFKCEKKSLNQLMPFSSNKRCHTTTLIDFNKKIDQKRIPLNQNIMPYC